MAWLWLLAANSTANATSSAISGAPSGAGWLTSLQHSFASAAAGNGLVIALVLAAVTAAIGVSVVLNWRPRAFLALAMILNLVYWVVAQGFGGILTGSGTDPNAYGG
jgi:preprotein translocase subunit SecF